VKPPTRNALGVLADEGALAGGNFQFVEIVPGLIAIVEADVERVRVGFGSGEQLHAHALQSSEVARGGDFGARRGGGGRIHRVDVVILVAIVVLHVNDILAVAAPEVAGDRPFGFRGEAPGVGEGRLGLFHPHVARVVPGLQKRDVFSIRRELRAGDLGIAEDQFAIDQRRKSAGFFLGEGYQGEGSG
jgi:hypothetical protein